MGYRGSAGGKLLLVGEPEDCWGREGIAAAGGGDRERVGLIDSEAISYSPNVKESYNILFLGLGDVGLVLNVSS